MVGVDSEPISVHNSWDEAVHCLLEALQYDIHDMPYWQQLYTKTLISLGVPIYIPDGERQVAHYIIKGYYHKW